MKKILILIKLIFLLLIQEVILKNSIISENNINTLQEKWEEKDIFNKLLEK